MPGFWANHSKPTEEQFALLGKSVTAWGIIDHLVNAVLARLAQTPDFIGLALTDDLGFRQRMTAINNLVDIHRRRYRVPHLDADTLSEAVRVAAALDKAKPNRNNMAHHVWMRVTDDQLFAVRLKGRQDNPAKSDGTQLLSNSELADLTAEAESLIGQLEALIDRLPEVPETR